jgi:hypothetical protein
MLWCKYLSSLYFIHERALEINLETINCINFSVLTVIQDSVRVVLDFVSRVNMFCILQIVQIFGFLLARAVVFIYLFVCLFVYLFMVYVTMFLVTAIVFT